ncbi:MAG: alpha/beta fold hydrolase [Planctomycetes bacterium]|nr:alpha/beta fold hydrolase [Planctomycetota bacterium]
MSNTMRITEFEYESEGERLGGLLAEPRDRAIDGPTPLVVSVAAGRHETMIEEPFNWPARLFTAEGYRAVTVDLPYHGDRAVSPKVSGLAGIVEGWATGFDPFTRFIKDCRALIDTLISRSLADLTRVYLYGTSRGGYYAARAAAADSRVAGLAMVAPVTDWRTLTEFESVKNRDDIAALVLEHYAPALAGRPVYATIPNRDNRVATERCLDFFEKLAAIEAQRGMTRSHLQLHMTPGDGHSSPDEWRHHAAEYLVQLTRER